LPKLPWQMLTVTERTALPQHHRIPAKHLGGCIHSEAYGAHKQHKLRNSNSSGGGSRDATVKDFIPWLQDHSNSSTAAEADRGTIMKRLHLHNITALWQR
jgi:hypothetical protein